MMIGLLTSNEVSENVVALRVRSVQLALQLAARSMRITATPVLAAASRLTPTTGRLAA